MVNKPTKKKLRDEILQLDNNDLVGLVNVLKNYQVDARGDRTKLDLLARLAFYFGRQSLHPDWYSPSIEIGNIINEYVIRRRS